MNGALLRIGTEAAPLRWASHSITFWPARSGVEADACTSGAVVAEDV